MKEKFQDLGTRIVDGSFKIPDLAKSPFPEFIVNFFNSFYARYPFSQNKPWMNF
jgi:hypothetical protein